MSAAVAQSALAPSAPRSHNYRPALLALAVLLAAATIFYGAAWIYYMRHAPPQVEIGIDESYRYNGVDVDNVRPNSPAEKAGLKPHDRIVGINGRTANSGPAWNGVLYRAWLGAKPGDTVTLSVQRPGQSQPLTITPVFRALQGSGDTKSTARTVALEILLSYPVYFVVVGLAVLLLRVEDRNAWLLALVLATFVTAAEMPNEFVAAPRYLQSFLLAFRSLGGSVLAALFYFFFAVFPKRSPIDRRAAWLKWVLILLGLCLGLGGYQNGNSAPLPVLARVLSNRAAQNAHLVVVYG
ncbi:MAG: PDZ domain-containing protein, partial [Bdellovibrionota bacterium]